MGSIKKHLTSTIVFIVNLALMGVGFLFIKNSDEAKKAQSMAADGQDFGDVSPDDATLDSALPTESSVNDSVVSSSTATPYSSDATKQTSSASNKASTIAAPKSTATSNNSTSTTSSNATTSKPKSSSSKKSSAKTKTS